MIPLVFRRRGVGSLLVFSLLALVFLGASGCDGLEAVWKDPQARGRLLRCGAGELAKTVFALATGGDGWFDTVANFPHCIGDAEQMLIERDRIAQRLEEQRERAEPLGPGELRELQQWASLAGPEVPTKITPETRRRLATARRFARSVGAYRRR